MKKFILFLFLLNALTMTGYAQRITVTLAGTTTAGYNGDGKSGLATEIRKPWDVCVDAEENIYFSDYSNNGIRKISYHDGTVSTIAGGGTLSGDGIPATNASIVPRNLCIDVSGNIIFVDTSSHKIRRVDAVTNLISTIAGNGTYGYSGDGGPATLASFGSLNGVCVDHSGNVYVVDIGNNRIRKITSGTGIINTIAGTGVGAISGDGGPATAAAINNTSGICVNASGDVFIADNTYSMQTIIRKINGLDGIINTIAGAASGPLYNVPATDALLGNVTGLCIDRTGNLYFNELSCSCRRMDMTTDSIYPEGGNYYVESFSNDTNSNGAFMNFPTGLCVDGSNNIIIADNQNSRIRKLILLKNVPKFAFGRGQYINPCFGATFPINLQMSITDIDSAQPETWTVIAAPTHGSLTGFPFSRPSPGPQLLMIPTGMSYIPGSGFAGSDSFQIRVTDGINADTTMVYVEVTPLANPGTIASVTGSGMCLGSSYTFTDTVSGGTWSVSNRKVDIAGTVGYAIGILIGLDTIIYTVANECGPMSAEYPVRVDTAAFAGAITGTDSVCTGTYYTVSDTASMGVWSATNSNLWVGVGLVSGVSQGIDTLIYSVTNACGTAMATMAITVTASPDPGVITGVSSICVGSTVLLTDSVAGGAWSQTNVSELISGTGSFTGLVAGFDTLKYSVTNSCGTANASLAVTINDCSLTINPVPGSHELTIYPNPVSELLNIEWTGWSAENKLVIEDIAGRALTAFDYTNTNGTGLAQFNVGNLAQGVYFIRINGTEVRQFVKE